MFMCDGARSAGLKVLTISELDKLGREHPDYWSDETMIEQYGDVSREFRT
jgi:hypothetical protein